MLDFINNIVWSDALLILLLGTGLMMSLKLRFFQVVKLPLLFKKTFFSLFTKGKRNGSQGVSQLQAAAAALGASMGTGNIIGVAAALTIGGAGAVFWMWVSAVLGMALSYSENYLGVLYKNKSIGGAPAYLELGTGKKWLGVLFCLFCVLASLGMGNMTQINSISRSLSDAAGIPTIYTGVVCGGLVFVIISGGIKRIGKVSQFLLPVISICYIVAAIGVIAVNYENLPHAVSQIFRGAFGIGAAAGGISGEVIRRSINTGLRRGVFSNEAGLGSSTLFHAAADNAAPQVQGMWAAAEVFIDTIVCCTLTALALLTSGSLGSGKEGTALVSEMFGCIMGEGAEWFTAAAVVLFAFATVISWFYCGECCVRYLFGEGSVAYYKVVFAMCVVVGAYLRLDTVWTLSDIFNGLMALPNLAGLIMLRKKVKWEKDR